MAVIIRLSVGLDSQLDPCDFSFSTSSVTILYALVDLFVTTIQSASLNYRMTTPSDKPPKLIMCEVWCA